MKTDVCLISSLRRPFRSLLLLILFGLISFGFITKTVQFLVIQRETKILGSYYRSIGVLANIKDPQSGDVSAGIMLIENSPYFAYGDQRRMASGIMQQTYNENLMISNSRNMNAIPKIYWPSVHETDLWFIGELIDREEINDNYQSENKKTIGYYLVFNIDTLLAAYPEDAKQGFPKSLLFMFEGNDSAIPIIQEMEVGQRYLIRDWYDVGFQLDPLWENTHGTLDQIKPIDDQYLWYLPVTKGVNIDFTTTEMASIKNEIDVLNENLHTLTIITTSDLSAMPWTQEASRFDYLIEGRWLNHHDNIAGSKVMVMPEDLAQLRGFKLGDEVLLNFRPLTDTYYGFIRDGVDGSAWKSYPTYQETFRIVGIYNHTSGNAFIAFIPNACLPKGFESSMEPQFRYGNDYSFVLDSSRNETQFTQEYKTPLEEMGISLTFLDNNGSAYWASVDPIRRSLSADVLIYGVLLIVALILAVFLYMTQHRREYAILRTLGVSARQANMQLILPLFLLGGFGIVLGGLPSWNYAINQAKASLSTLPTPAGVYPSADLNLIVLVGLFIVVFLLMALLSSLGILLLSHRPVFELLQGQSSQNKTGKKQARNTSLGETNSSAYSTSSSLGRREKNTPQESFLRVVNPTSQVQYTPSSMINYVVHHILRSCFKSILTLAIGFVFILASGWILRTMEQSRKEVNRLYDTTVVEADIIQTNSAISKSGGTGFISRKTIDSVINSGFVKSSILEADTSWSRISKINSQDEFTDTYPVYAYDSSETMYSSLADQGSLIFASGWDINSFAKQLASENIQKEGIPAIFPKSLLDQLQLNVGGVIKITDQHQQTYSCVIVGQYSGGRISTINTIKITWMGPAGESILIPLSVLESMERSQTQFTIAHFVLDPKKNRELPQFRADMEKVMKAYGSGLGGIRLILWDEELRTVVAQLEKNISILQILYPVLIAVSVLIGAGLCFLLLLQAAREAALLRMLGVTKTGVRLTLISEPLLLSIMGVIIGLVAFRLLWTGSNLVTIGSLLLGTGLYLAGVLTGLMIGSISVTNKKPMELLQVKE